MRKWLVVGVWMGVLAVWAAVDLVHDFETGFGVGLAWLTGILLFPLAVLDACRWLDRRRGAGKEGGAVRTSVLAVGAAFGWVATAVLLALFMRAGPGGLLRDGWWIYQLYWKATTLNQPVGRIVWQAGSDGPSLAVTELRRSRNSRRLTAYWVTEHQNQSGERLRPGVHGRMPGRYRNIFVDTFKDAAWDPLDVGALLQ